MCKGMWKLLILLLLLYCMNSMSVTESYLFRFGPALCWLEAVSRHDGLLVPGQTVPYLRVYPVERAWEPDPYLVSGKVYYYYFFYLKTKVMIIRITFIRSGSILPLVECIYTGQHAPVQIEPCHIDCSGSCILSSWSAWSTCPTTCGSTRSRQRHSIGNMNGRRIIYLKMISRCYIDMLYLMVSSKDFI